MVRALDSGTQRLIAWAGDERAIVAITFTDIRNSTVKTDAVGNEAWHEIVECHFAQSARFTEQHNGLRISNLGDGEMLIFKNVEEALDYTLALHADPGVSDVEVRAGVHVAWLRAAAQSPVGEGLAVALGRC